MMSNADFTMVSPTTCNLNFTNHVYEAFKDYSQVNVICADFEKAFNSLNDNVLVKILKTSGEHLLFRF